MQTLTLVSHHLCPYVQRAAIALLEKGVPFEKILIDLADKPAWFLSLSPLGKVPLLIVRQPDRPQAVLFESSVICEYIEETRAGPRLHPGDPLLRAQHRAWMEYGSTILSDVWGLETTPDATIYEQKRTAIADKFERLEAVLDNGPYFAGKDFSLVDAVFAPVFRYFDLFDTIAETAVFANTPRIRAWRAALAERASVQQAVGPDYPERLHAFLRRHNAYLLKAA